MKKISESKTSSAVSATKKAVKVAVSSQPAPKLWSSYMSDMIKADIQALSNVLCLGYSERNWREAEHIRQQLSKVADLSLTRQLGDMIREAYTHLNYASVEQAKQSMFAHIEAHSSKV